VGEIEDEFDVAPQPTLLLAGGALVLSGSENIRDLEARHPMRFPRDEGFETLAGFILFKLGHIPKGGETVEHNGHRFTVLNMEGHRIAKVKVEAMQPRPAISGA
jgi:CBS domain containing-hemolysin-like protein